MVQQERVMHPMLQEDYYPEAKRPEHKPLLLEMCEWVQNLHILSQVPDGDRERGVCGV